MKAVFYHTDSQAKGMSTTLDTDHHKSSGPRKWMDHTQAKISDISVTLSLN